MKLTDMTASEILEACDFPDSFVEDFKKWCESRPDAPKLSGLAAWRPVYKSNFFTKMLPKDGFKGKYYPVSIVYEKKENE